MYYSTLALKHHGFFFIMGEYRHELYFIRGVEMGGGVHTVTNRGYFPDCNVDPHALFYLM